MASVVPDLNYADIKEVECALSAQPGLSCRYQIRIGGKVLVTAMEEGGGWSKLKCLESKIIPSSDHENLENYSLQHI